MEEEPSAQGHLCHHINVQSLLRDPQPKKPRKQRREVRSCKYHFTECLRDKIPTVLINLILEYTSSHIFIDNYQGDAITTSDKKVHVLAGVLPAPLPAVIRDSDYDFKCHVGDWLVPHRTKPFVLHYSAGSTKVEGSMLISLTCHGFVDAFVDPRDNRVYLLRLAERTVQVYSTSLKLLITCRLSSVGEYIRSFTASEREVFVLSQGAESEHWWRNIPTISVIDVDTGDQKREFQVHVASDTKYWRKQMVICGNILYVTSERGILVLDAKTGDEMDVMKDTEAVQSLFLSDGQVFYIAKTEEGIFIDQMLYF